MSKQTATETTGVLEALRIAEKYVRWASLENGTKKSQDDHKKVLAALQQPESLEAAREAAFEDRLKLDEGLIYESQAVYNALAVMILSPNIRAFLTDNDPKALEQARRALGVLG